MGSDNVTYQQVLEYIDIIAADLEGSYDMIVGMNRGGLVPAVYLSHRLGIPMQVADVVSKASRGDNIGWHSGHIPRLSGRVLVVDDIVDSGQAIVSLANCTKIQFDVAALLFKESAAGVIENCGNIGRVIYGKLIPNDAPFINFPWEV